MEKFDRADEEVSVGPSLSEALEDEAATQWFCSPESRCEPQLGIIYQNHEVPLTLNGELKKSRSNRCLPMDGADAQDVITEAITISAARSPTTQALSLKIREIEMVRMSGKIEPYFQRENYFVNISGLVVLKAAVWTFYDGTIQTLECKYDSQARPIEYIERINGEIIRTDTLTYQGATLIKRESRAYNASSIRNVIGETVKATESPQEAAKRVGIGGYIPQFAVSNPRGVLYDERYILFSAA